MFYKFLKIVQRNGNQNFILAKTETLDRNFSIFLKISFQIKIKQLTTAYFQPILF